MEVVAGTSESVGREGARSSPIGEREALLAEEPETSPAKTTGTPLRRVPSPRRSTPPTEGRSGDALLTAHQVAEILGVPTSWVYEQSRSGRIPTVTLGRYRRYRREAIEGWLRELEAPARRMGANGGARK